MLFAAALPLMAYWYYSNQQPEEGEQELDCAEDNIKGGGTSDDLAFNLSLDDEVNPYDMSFWGPEATAKRPAPDRGAARRLAHGVPGEDTEFDFSVGLDEALRDVDFGLDLGLGHGGAKGGGKGKSKGKGKGHGDVPGGGAPRQPNPRQVFVGGLGDLSEESVRTFFEQVGEVERVKVLCHPDGLPRGRGFVTFRTEEQARDACSLSGSQLQGRRIFVEETMLKGDRRVPGPAKGGKGAGQPAEPRREIDEILEDALEEEAGPLQLSDFDAGSKRFLEELMRRDRLAGTRRSVMALELVFKQVRHKQRADVRKWPAYVFTLLEKFDPQLCDDLAVRKLSEATGGLVGRAARGEVPREGDIKRAWEYVPADDGETRQVLDRWGKPVLL